MQEGSRSRGQDDLTHKLQDINKRSIELSNFTEGKHWSEYEISLEIMEKLNKLQFEVFTYMNNNIRGQKQSTQRSGAPTKSLTDRLRGKDGRIRGKFASLISSLLRILLQKKYFFLLTL